MNHLLWTDTVAVSVVAVCATIVIVAFFHFVNK